MTNWLKCLLGFHESANPGGQYDWCDRCDKEIKLTCTHEWETPDNGCCGKRLGVRECVKCGRVESLLVSLTEGSGWFCTEASLQKSGHILSQGANDDTNNQ
jgi:hypothetical protein